MSELTSGQRGITTPDQPANPARRSFLRNTAIAGTLAVVELFAPGVTQAAVRAPEPANLPSIENQRIAEATRRLEEMRSRRMELVPATVEPGEIRGVKSFAPGDRVDRGNPDEQVFYLRGDDFWWEEAGNAYLDVIEAEQIPAVLCPVEEAVVAFPNLIKRADSLKDSKGRRLIIWANHTKGHEALDQKTKPDVMRALLPQTHTLENLLLREERSLFVAPPYGAGAMPGYSQTDRELKSSARGLQSAILGWTIDTRSWDNATEDQIYYVVTTKIVNGAVIITHPVPSGNETRALQRWIRDLRAAGWRAGSLAELAHPKTAGH